MLSTNSYLLKTETQGLQLLKLEDMGARRYTQRHLMDAHEKNDTHTTALDFTVSESQITIATSSNEFTIDYNGNVLIMNIPLAGS